MDESSVAFHTPEMKSQSKQWLPKGSLAPDRGTCQGPLDAGEEKKVRRSQIRRIRRVEEGFDTSDGQKTSDGGAGVDRSVVPVQKPLSCSHLQPLPVKNLHELAGDLYDVINRS